ncbi:MAG: helix-turn-helix transcriptional regulator [Bacteroidota bacterium]
MDVIPKINFEEARSPLVGFDLFSLESLFSRHADTLDHNPHQPHRLGFHVLLWIREGKVKHTVDFHEYTLGEGQALLITKGQVHAFNAECEYQGYILLFTEEFLLQQVPAATQYLVDRLHYSPLGGVQNPTQLSLIQQWEPLLEEVSSPKIGQSEMVGAWLSMLLIYVERSQPQTQLTLTTDVHFSLFEQFQQQVEVQYAQSRDAKVYAEALGISYKHLNEVSKKFTGKTAKAFIDEYVLLESKRFLISSTQSVKEIAYRCGFDEPTNFLKYFKNLTGMTPQQFRGG